MKVKNIHLGLDSMCFTYLITTLQECKEPADENDELKQQKLALVRLFMHVENVHFWLSPTVITEYERIREENKKELHRSWNSTHFSEFNPLPCDHTIQTLKNIFMTYHNKENDCKILAEYLSYGIYYTLTFDREYTKRLNGQSYQDNRRIPTIKEGRKRTAIAQKREAPVSSLRPYSSEEMAFMEAYGKAAPSKRRWMAHRQNRWSKARRGVIYKQRALGDRIWENFNRTRENYRRQLKKHEGLRQSIALARSDHHDHRRAHYRATQNLYNVFRAAYANPDQALSFYQTLITKLGRDLAMARVAKRSELLGRRRGSSLFGMTDNARRDGDKMLCLLSHRTLQTISLGHAARNTESWLTRLRNQLERGVVSYFWERYWQVHFFP